jgi:hypothetical protein
LASGKLKEIFFEQWKNVLRIPGGLAIKGSGRESETTIGTANDKANVAAAF